MARRKSTKKDAPVVKEPEVEIVKEEVIVPEKPVKKEKKKTEKIIEPKFKIGDIVFISKDADADLNGFKLFPQYKKYTYTVEAYEPDTDVYTLRKLNFTLKLKGELILAPDERAHDSINRKRF